MSQAVHIFRKDLRRLRWWLAAWVALLLARVLLATAGAYTAAGGLGEQLVIEQVNGAIGLAAFVMFGLLVARLVHDEPLVGLDWFWLTRPYDRSALLGAKLGFAVLFFVVLPLVAEFVVMATFDAGPGNMGRASSLFLARDARWTLGLMVFAVVTPTLVAFALGLAATAAAAGLVMLGVLAVAILRMTGETRPSAAPADATAAVVATAVFILASLLVIAYQYHRRRRSRALLLAAVGLVAVMTVPALWPWPLARAPVIELGPRATDPDHVSVSVDRSVPPELADEPPFRRRDTRRRQITVPLLLTGLPPEYRAQMAFVESRMELPDGHVLESRQSSGLLSVMSDADMEPVHPLQGPLGDVRVLPVAERASMRPRTALLAVTDEELTTYEVQPGRLSTTLHIPLQRSQVIGALPLAEGTTFDHDGMRIEMVRIQRRHDGCTLLLRQWRVMSIVSPPEYRQYEFVLRNVERREAYAGTPQGGFAGGGFPSFLLFGFTSNRGREGFSVQHLWVDYLPRWGAASRATIDPQWLDAADLAIVETVPAGVITRTLVLEDFTIQSSRASQ